MAPSIVALKPKRKPVRKSTRSAARKSAAAPSPAASSPTKQIKWTKTHQLVGVALRLCPSKDMSLPNKIATALHGWFLDQVAKTDEALSAHLHDNQEEKAFVLSGILGSAETGDSRLGAIVRQDDGIQLAAGEQYHLVITGLSKPICNWLKEWVTQLPPSLKFRRGGQLPIHGWEAVCTPTTYAQLFTQAKKDSERATKTGKAKADNRTENKITFSFLSPTSFRSKGNHLPLPLPKNLFHSYLRRWNSFAAKPIEEDAFLDWVERAVTIVRYELHTQKTAVAKGGLVTGFVGSLDLAITPKGRNNKRFVQAFYALSKLAPYCGTGHKTTFGLGQTRLGKVAVVRQATAAATVQPASLAAPSPDIPPETQALAQRYSQTALRIEELKQLFLSHRQAGSERAARKAVAMATIVARREVGESLKAIAQDLRLNYETAKSYSKWAKKELETGEVRQK